ncbi:endolytic transglycosylase MltG [Cellulosimicrobium sp. NPDC057127]|uniref:endolytic transglycosylase MltG n=1 Tax=Cellulosimicrobium sp. NPDC057127 TaxID=3346026 RepID=UPI00362CFBF2
MTDLFDRPAVRGDEPPSRSSRSEQRARRAAKKRRQRRRRRALVVVLVSLLVVGGAGYVIATNATSLFGFDNPLEAKDFEGPGTEPVDVTIEPGSTGRDMGATLVEAGVVASTAAFVTAFEENPSAGTIQPGTHTLLTEMSAEDAVARLVANDSRVETKITIPEGWTVEQVLERASSVTGIPVEEFRTAMEDTAATGLPAEANGNYEGWLFPTTYVLQPDETTAVGIIGRMVSQTIMKLDEAGVPAADRETVLIKASLIEREAKFAPDRPKMAQAIENRLADGMPLEIDAAVAYGAGKPGTELTRADLDDASNPYNTYENKGLPPSPIANPGSESIQAVMNPEPGDWIFWTAVNLDTGETKFATTYAEHQQNVLELRAWQEANGG